MAYSKVIVNGSTIMDVTQDTVAANKLYANYTAHDSSGTQITGTAEGGSVLIVDTPDSHGGTIREITTQNEILLQGEKHISLSNIEQIITPDTGYDGFSSVIVDSNREDLVEPKDVDFIDYDGQLVYSYTAQEFLSLTAFPPNPSNSGLVAQGWNWDLADAKDFVSKYGSLVIGQSYTTDNGRTKIYLNFPSYEGAYGDIVREVDLTLRSDTFGSPKIYWGDGTSSIWPTAANTGGKLAHTYQNPGKYIIEIEVTSGNITLLSQNSGNQTLLGGDWDKRGYLNKYVEKIEIGNNVTQIGCNAFNWMAFKSISIPISVTEISDYSSVLIEGCVNIKGIVFPKNIDSSGTASSSWFNGNKTIRYISVPKGLHALNINSGGGFPYLRKMIVASSTLAQLKNITRIPVYFGSAVSLTHFVVLGDYTNIPGDTIRETRVKKIYIPSMVTSVSNNAYQYNRYCEEVHCYSTTPPTLGGTTVFRDVGSKLSSPTIFYVPYSSDHSVLAAYQSATNWSTYADQMQEEPQS